MADWLELAKKLPLGRKTRFIHGCGEDKSAIASHGPDGYSGYCFRCGKLGFHPHGRRTLEELRELRELNAQAYLPQPTELPDDFTPDIPSIGRMWLCLAGISSARANALGFGWSPRLKRVVLPVSSTYWQARAVAPGQQPKYLNPDCADRPLYECPPHPDALRDRGLVITEDILSACRVGKHVLAASALGTKLSDAAAVRAVRLAGGMPIYIWLDPDPAGEAGAAAMRRILGALSDDVRIVSSRVDPKLMSDREIREHLNLPPNERYTYHV